MAKAFCNAPLKPNFLRDRWLDHWIPHQRSNRFDVQGFSG
jgi:hypothetical protein